MKIISVIGYSGTGKTYFIENAIKMLKHELNINVAVIKNIHQHKIDKEGKDSYRFIEAGAIYSIIKNIFNENAILFKHEIDVKAIIKWLSNGPFKIDLIFIEGFRNLPYPTILCVNQLSEIKSQLSDKIKMISGLISIKELTPNKDLNIPIVNINQDFRIFLNIFNIG